MGVTGFTVLDGQPVVDSLFLSMEMYFLNYSDSPPNILIEIARWTAPLMTASGVLMSISKIRGRILQLLRYYRGDSIAVYGDNIHRKEMVQALGSCGIDAGEDWEWVKAKKYLLLGNEDENFRFYGQHREAFAGHTVYLKSENLAAEGILDPHLRLFCPEETAARLYWRRNCLYETSCAHGHRLQIVFLGFGLLGKNFWNLQTGSFCSHRKGSLEWQESFWHLQRVLLLKYLRWKTTDLNCYREENVCMYWNGKKKHGTRPTYWEQRYSSMQ